MDSKNNKYNCEFDLHEMTKITVPQKKWHRYVVTAFGFTCAMTLLGVVSKYLK